MQLQLVKTRAVSCPVHALSFDVVWVSEIDGNNCASIACSLACSHHCNCCCNYYCCNKENDVVAVKMRGCGELVLPPFPETDVPMALHSSAYISQLEEVYLARPTPREQV